METKSMLQIVSGFKPSVDGMGDFSRRLGAALWKQDSIRSHFLVYHRPRSPLNLEEIQPNTLSYPAEPTASSFREHLSQLRSERKFDCVLMHYGPYAYSRDGRPAAFTEVIEELAQSARLLVFLHEICAGGMPWKKAFWTRREQQASASTLLRIADVAFTSNPLYLLWARPLNSTGREIIQVPIFSNIGEPEGLRPLAQRTRRLVIFGQLVTRLRLYKDWRKTLEEVCRKLRIETIVDVGSGESPQIPTEILGVKVVRSGWMEEEQLSELMADSIAGIIGYWPDVWQKSGVIAAYQAHALVPIMVEVERRSLPKPAFLPFISPQDVSRLPTEAGTVTNASLQAIADAAHDQYTRNQSVSHCAEVIARYAFPG